MTLYRVIMVVLERRQGKLVVVDKASYLIADQIETAQRRFAQLRDEAQGYFQFSGYFGRVQLFRPTILENGEVADYADEPSDYLFGYTKHEGGGMTP